MKDAISKLLGSHKALMLIVALACMTLLCALGKIPGERVFIFLTVTFPAWLLGQSWVDSQTNPAPITVSNQDAVKLPPTE